MTSSVSFRITRTAEDLAQTITALSQRLVKLEQRQDAIEFEMRQVRQHVNRIPDEEISTLDGIDAMLKETRELLQNTEARAINPGVVEASIDDPTPAVNEQPWQDPHSCDFDEQIAA